MVAQPRGLREEGPSLLLLLLLDQPIPITICVAPLEITFGGKRMGPRNRLKASIDMTSEPWWAQHTTSINGIFKGGGAKGLLYAGAIRAVADGGYWFRAVAGSSAGAITAMLLASGMTSDALDQAVPVALRRIQRNWAGELVGRAFIGTENLAVWIEEVLTRQIIGLAGTRPSDQPVTFGELFSATGIELYVVCVDVARRQPVVFNSLTTPGISVTAAVVASSSIPLFFRPGRLEVRRTDGATRVHRLMDGGVWANYPAFVFKDSSFRDFHCLPPVPMHSLTIGFTIEHPTKDPGSEPIRLLGWDRSPVRADSGALLRGPLKYAPFRLYFLAVVPVIVAIQIAWTFGQYGLLFLKDFVYSYEWVPHSLVSLAGLIDGWFTKFYWGPLTVVAALLAVAAISLVAGATLLDSALPAFLSLMSVGTNAPYWVGAAADDHVVRLDVPPHLGTFSFRTKPEDAAVWIDEARESARKQLTKILKATT